MPSLNAQCCGSNLNSNVEDQDILLNLNSGCCCQPNQDQNLIESQNNPLINQAIITDKPPVNASKCPCNPCVCAGKCKCNALPKP